jgi:hypothetical protein
MNRIRHAAAIALMAGAASLGNRTGFGSNARDSAALE